MKKYRPFVKLVALFSVSFFIANSQINSTKQESDRIIIDSNLSFKEAFGTQAIPTKIKEQLCVINVRYYSLDGKIHQGRLIIHKELKEDINSIFSEILNSKFPIAKVIPISKYKYSDYDSMKANNTSGFNYRVIEGTKKLSNHALGRAIDINPFLNPAIRKGKVVPEGATYNPKAVGTITEDGIVVTAFKKRGWKWGGEWKNQKDYQHFEKNI